MPKTPSSAHRKTLRLLLILGTVVLLLASVTAVYASLIDTTAVVENRLQTVSVPCAVTEDNAVRNDGNIPALIRAKVIINWVNGEGKILAEAPAGASRQLTFGEGWTGDASDPQAGYWYYSGIVSPDAVTTPLITGQSASGGTLQVIVLAESIQATPAEAATSAWGMSYSNGQWSTP